MNATTPITPKDLSLIEGDIRSMIQHDSELLNHRIQWFLTMSGFLFTAVALYGNQPGRNWFGTLLAIIGLLTCITFCVALKIGRNAMRRLGATWKEYRARSDGNFNEVGVLDTRRTNGKTGLGRGACCHISRGWDGFW